MQVRSGEGISNDLNLDYQEFIGKYKYKQETILPSFSEINQPSNPMEINRAYLEDSNHDKLVKWCFLFKTFVLDKEKEKNLSKIKKKRSKK